MNKLKDSVNSSQSLSDALKENGASHKNYKFYTSMEQALDFLRSGYLYLSNGSNWNDNRDKEDMMAKKAFAKCFTWSTRENVAMWMLYGAGNGSKGAMLNFYPSTIKEILGSKSIELGKFKNGKFLSAHTISSSDDFEIFLTDMLYIEKCKNHTVKITCGDEHVTADVQLINYPDIFHKTYPWSYERECRLVVKLSKEWQEICERDNLNSIRITISDRMLRRLKDGLIRSPIYSGNVDDGVPSQLTGEVNWSF